MTIEMKALQSENEILGEEMQGIGGTKPPWAKRRGIKRWRKPTVDDLLSSVDLPYSVETMTVPLLRKFEVSEIELYDESNDLVEPPETFKAHMKLHGFSKEVVCWAFSLMLKGVVRG